MARVVRTPFVDKDLVLASLPADAASRAYHLEPCVWISNVQGEILARQHVPLILADFIHCLRAVYAFAVVETKHVWVIRQSAASDPHTRDRPGQVRAFALSSIEGEVLQDELDRSAPTSGTIRSTNSRLTRIMFSVRHSNGDREDVTLLSTERDSQLGRFIASALRSARTNVLLDLVPAPSEYPPKPEQATKLVYKTLDAVRAAIPGMSLRGVSSTSAHAVLASEGGGGHAAARLRSSMRALQEAGSHANPRGTAAEISVNEHISRSVDPGDYSLELLMTGIASGRVAVKAMDRLGTPIAKHRAITAAFFASDLPITLISLLLTCADTFDAVVELMRSPVIRSMSTCKYDGRIVLELQVVRMCVLRAGAALMHAALHDSAGIPQRSMLANPLPFGLTVLSDVLIRGFRHGLQPELYMHGRLVLENGKAADDEDGLRVRVVRPYKVLHAIPLRAGTRTDGYNFGTGDDADGEGEGYLIGRGLGITVSRLKQGSAGQSADVNMQATFQAALRKARREQEKKAGHRDGQVGAASGTDREVDLVRSIRSRGGAEADPATRRAISGIVSDLYGLSTPEPFNYTRYDDASVDVNAAVESAYFTARTERVTEAKQRIKDRETALVRAKEVAEARQRQAEIRAGARRGWGLLRSRWEAAGPGADEDEATQEDLPSSDEEGEPIVIPELSFQRPASPELVGSRSAAPGARHLLPDEAIMPLARVGAGSPGKGSQALAESTTSLEDSSVLFRTALHGAAGGSVPGTESMARSYITHGPGSGAAFGASNRSHPYARYKDSDAVREATGVLLSQSAVGGVQANTLRSSMGMSRAFPSASSALLPIPASPMPRGYTVNDGTNVKVLPLHDQQLREARAEQEQGGDLTAVLSASKRRRGQEGSSPTRKGQGVKASSPSSPMRFTDLDDLVSASVPVQEEAVQPEPVLLELLAYAAEEARDYRDIATGLLAELDDVVATSHIALLRPGERMRVTDGSGRGAHGMMDDLRLRNTTAGSTASVHSYASNRGKVIAAELINYQSDLADPVANRHHYMAIHKHLPGVRAGGALHAKRLLSSAVMHGPGLGGPLGQGAIPDQQDEGWWYGPYGEDAMQGVDEEGQGTGESTYTGAVAGSDKGHSLMTDVEGRKLRAGIANVGSEPAKSIAEALSRLPTLEAVSFLSDQARALDTLIRIAMQARKTWDTSLRTILMQGSEDEVILLAAYFGFSPRHHMSTEPATGTGSGTPMLRGVGGYTGSTQDRPHIAAGAAGTIGAGSAIIVTSAGGVASVGGAEASAASSFRSSSGLASSSMGASSPTALYAQAQPLPSAFSSGSGQTGAAMSSATRESFPVGAAAPASSSAGSAVSSVQSQGQGQSAGGLSNFMLMRSGYLPRASPGGPVSVKTGPTLTESLRSVLRLGGPRPGQQGAGHGQAATPATTPAPYVATSAPLSVQMPQPAGLPPVVPASGSQSRYTGPSAAQLSVDAVAQGQAQGTLHQPTTTEPTLVQVKREEQGALTAAMLERPMDGDFTEEGMAALAHLQAFLSSTGPGPVGEVGAHDRYAADPLPIVHAASTLGAQLTDADVNATAQYRDPLFAVRVNMYARLLLACVRDSPSLRTASIRAVRDRLATLAKVDALEHTKQGNMADGAASVASLASTRLANSAAGFASSGLQLDTSQGIGWGQGTGVRSHADQATAASRALQRIFHAASEPLFAEAVTTLLGLRAMLSQ